jgi:hypothetical protein
MPAGVYFERSRDRRAGDFGNQSRLLLPFGVGVNIYGRSTNGIPFRHNRTRYNWDGVSGGYQRICNFSGFLPVRSQSAQAHAVFLN